MAVTSTIIGVVTPKTADDWNMVETREDFIALVELLAVNWNSAEAERADRERQGLWTSEWNGWAHGTPGDWLEAMHTWLTARRPPDLVPEFETVLEGPTWRTFASILSASRCYE